MSTVRARRRRARARRPREEQGQQARTLGNHHFEASPLRSVRGTFEATRRSIAEAFPRVVPELNRVSMYEVVHPRLPLGGNAMDALLAGRPCFSVDNCVIHRSQDPAPGR